MNAEQDWAVKWSAIGDTGGPWEGYSAHLSGKAAMTLARKALTEKRKVRLENWALNRRYDHESVVGMIKIGGVEITAIPDGLCRDGERPNEGGLIG